MLDEMKKDIEKEFSEIWDYNNDCENKQQVLQANTNDSKLTKTGVIGMLSIIPSMIVSMVKFAPLTTGLPLPVTATMSVVLASSIVIGYVTQSIITSISKKKMKKFTDAKTNTDILQEMMYYEMEINKSKNKKEVLRKMYKNVESKQQILSDYSTEFYQIDKYAKLTSEDLKKRKEMLIKAYDERMEQLEVLTSQAYLKNKFSSRRKKRERIEGIITSALMMSFPFCFVLGVPLVLELMRNANLESMAEFGKIFALAFSPTLVVTPLALPYFIKRNKDFINAFNNLNQSLGENALSEKPNVKYEEELSNMISKKIEEVVQLGMELKEIGYAIEKRSTEITTDSKDKSKEKTCDDVMHTKDEMHQYIQMPKKPVPFDSETIFGKDENTEEQTNSLQYEESGPRLVKKRIPPKK